VKRQTDSFRLIICGQSFRQTPPVFRWAQCRFQQQIEHWGYAPSRADYERRLAGADVIVSTAAHEFFGLAVLEAIALGLEPLLPERLSYPELLELDHTAEAQAFFYEGTAESLARRLLQLIDDRQGLQSGDLQRVLARTCCRYRWCHRASQLDEALDRVAAKFKPPTGR
jgi:glycosyltransferase involved in cell wall biosynthesis